MTTLFANRFPLTERRERLFTAGVTLLGLALRLLLWSSQAQVSVDGITFIRLARALGGEGVFDAAMPPGYPALILIAQTLARDWVLAARLVDLLAGLALIPLTWLLARSFVPLGWLRLMPALAVALLPLPVRYSLTTMSEAPYLALLLGAFVLAARRREAAAGILGGLSCLVRPEAVTALLVLAVFRRRRPKRAALLLGGLALVVLPVLAAQGLATGVWRLGGELGDGAGSFAGRLGGNALHALQHGGWAVPLLGLAGLASPAAPLGSGLVQFLVTPLLAQAGHPRFILPYLPFLWVLAAVFLARAGRGMRLALGVPALAGLLATAVAEAPSYRLQEDGAYPELVEAGLWLRPYVRPGMVVYDLMPHAAFYAGAQHRVVPGGGYDEMLDAIVREGGDFLIVDEATVGSARPEFRWLIMDKGVVGHESRLRPVHLNFDHRGRHVIIYRVLRPGGPEPLPTEEGMKEQMARITHQDNHFVHGILAMRSERWQAAAGEFAYVIRADSTNASAFNNRAWCLLQADVALGNAESDARIATRLDPDNPDYLDTLIAVLRRAGKAEEAARLEARLRELEARRGEPR